MSELKPKFKVNEVVRAEWEGKSVIAKIIEVNIFKKLNFIGYKLDTDQFFSEKELSTDIRVGNIVKSEFNGIISLVTKTGTENANTVGIECVNNGSFRLLTDLEIKQLAQDDLMQFVCKDKYPDVQFKVGDFVISSSSRFNGVQEIVSIRKEQDCRIQYLISDNGRKIWCNTVDLKKWIPSVNERVVTDKILSIFDSYNDSYSAHQYTIISTVVEVREKENIVILEDYSSAKFEDLTPLSNYEGN
jgi:hypothetical protein